MSSIEQAAAHYLDRNNDGFVEWGEVGDFLKNFILSLPVAFIAAGAVLSLTPLGKAFWAGMSQMH